MARVIPRTAATRVRVIHVDLLRCVHVAVAVLRHGAWPARVDFRRLESASTRVNVLQSVDILIESSRVYGNLRSNIARNDQVDDGMLLRKKMDSKRTRLD
ncbi:hypothetical protein X777_05890 [Ooceraea biroi]|uniref:Uncharacterized protein n=1 Tax=Ooceraea biroi TaxID=2015173 RepID=A0A026WEF1_OOCBI|nr:hypothetical protein X777_05890 [Ooceraea biroi]